MADRLTSLLLGFVCLLFMPFWAYSQANDDFVKDSLKLSPDLQAIVEANPESYPESYRFFINSYQNNSLGEPIKNNILQTLLNLEEKGVRIRYNAKEILDALRIAQQERNFDATAMQNLSEVMLQASIKMDIQKINRFTENLYTFLKYESIFEDRYQSVSFKNADYKILYNTYQDEGPIVFKQPAQEVDLAKLKAQAAGTYVEKEEVIKKDPYNEPLPELSEEMGFVIYLQKGDIYFESSIDTFKIEQTTGYYLLEEEIFRGQDGFADWSNVGIRSSERQMRLNRFEFKPDQQVFIFTDVLLQQPSKIDGSVPGDLTINIIPGRGERNSYPRFISYNANTPIKGLGSKNLIFQGGINYQGTNFFSRTAYDEPSTLIGNYDGEKKFMVRSKGFVFNNEDSTVLAEDAQVILYHGTDSIYHPAASFQFNYKNQQLTAESSVPGYKTTPFRSSYYNIDLVGDEINWNLSSKKLDLFINSARSDVPLTLESKDYYSADTYNDLGQIFSFHPLIVAISMADKYGGKFYTNQLAKDYKLNEELVKKTMKFLMSKGMVNFDEVTNQVEVLQKGYHYLQSYYGDKDYDDIMISSTIANMPNATFNFEDSTLYVRGVEQFQISDSLDVVITPNNGEIRLLKNRDVEFDGSLDAGNFQFNGENFTFRYDSFLVNLVKIDSIKLKVEMEEGQRQALSNQLVKTSGVLVINETNNKSSLKSMPDYPKFSSSENASVVFNKSEVLEGAYDSTVYFDIPPFQLDSVADADPSKYAFGGTFYSNKILPDFEEDLKIMEDKSFGFIHDIPDSGYDVYQTGGRLFGDVQLDKRGISSPGTIEFLSGTFNNESATFFLDSMVVKKGIEGKLTATEIDGISFPKVNIEAYEMNWLAKKDSMVVKNLEEEKPFLIFDQEAKLNGEMTLRKSGLFGKGNMSLQGSDLTSDSIAFTQGTFEARESSFQLNAENARKPILSSQNVRINFDINNNQAKIQPEVAGSAVLDFPSAMFKTSIPSALWDVNEKKITMSKPDDVPLEKSFFYSTKKSFDSLVFNATDAVYNIESKELNITGIPYITVGSARVTPEGNELTVLENSEIGVLTNAVVVIDTSNSFHRLFDAEITITSRRSFKGKGTYELITLQDTFAIEFNQFEFVDKDKEYGPHTKASGTVKENQNILISPGFIFAGKVTMLAYKKVLELEGAVKLDLKKLEERNIWIEYTSTDDIAEVIIPFDQALTRQGRPLNAGVHFEDGQPYISFITEKRSNIDDDFFIPKGGDLYFDEDNGAYKIENPKKKEDPSQFLAGSMFSYNEKSQNVTFEGKLNLLSGKPTVQIEAAGKGKGNLDSLNFEVSTMFSLNLGFPIESAAAMAGDLKKMGDTLGIAKAHADRSELIYRVAEFIGNEATLNWDRSYQTLPQGLVNVAGEVLNRDLVVTDVNLKWSKQNKAFYSEGKIAVSNVSNVDLNLLLDGYMEVRKTPEGDILNLLLEMTDGTWYYFMFDGFSLNTFSSNEAYNATISSINSEKTKGGNFKAYPVTIEEVRQWVMDFRKLYYGIDEPYRLLMSGESSQTLKNKKKLKGDGF